MCERYHQTTLINMMDYMSDFPPPTKSYAVDEVFNAIKCTSKRINAKISNKFLYYLVEKSYNEFYERDNIGRGSLAGWHAFESKRIIQYAFDNIDDYLRKKRALKGALKAYGILNLIYKDTLERHYAPGGRGMQIAHEEFMCMNPVRI